LKAASNPSNVDDWWREVARRFNRAKLVFGHGTSNARDEAAWLVCHALHIPFAELSGALDRAVGTTAARRIDALVSAGYMRLLGKAVLDVYGGRWLNIHPALLPSFPGMHGVRDALAYGVKITGVTVFLVDEGVDTGPIVAQEAVSVRDDDDWDSLEVRIHAAEHRVLPAAVRALLEDRLRVEGRQVRVEEPTDG